MDPETKTHLGLGALERRLREALLHLPGATAQSRMAPRPRPGWRPAERPGGIRQAAALVLLYPRNGQPHVVLTVRAGALPNHAGQVSFPGGAVEPGEAIATAALREAAEEIGIDPAPVRVLGALTPLHIPVSDFLVHPVLAVLDTAPMFTHAAAEVDRVVEVPVAALLDPATRRVTNRMRDGDLVEVPYFDVGGAQVWGATAMMLAELLWMIEER